MKNPSISRLDRWLEADFDFTYINEVAITLLNIITWSIKLGATDYVLIFNDHCYDFQDFGQYRIMEYGCIEKRKDTGYRTKAHFKDPCTGEEFEYFHAMNGLCICQLIALNLREMIVR